MSEEDPQRAGYDKFPYRSEERRKADTERGFFTKIWTGRENKAHFDCEARVQWCVKNDNMVRLMMAAMKAHGCEVKLGRHVSCEKCEQKLSGGFDPKKGQVVVCQNHSKNRPVVCSVVAHELIHAFDFCRANADFVTSLDHHACTEVRAANLMHCTYGAAIRHGSVPFGLVKDRQQDCVRFKALQSVMAVRKGLDLETAMIAIDRVFDRCYADLEPVGRVPMKHDERDFYRAYAESVLFKHKVTEAVLTLRNYVQAFAPDTTESQLSSMAPFIDSHFFIKCPSLSLDLEPDAEAVRLERLLELVTIALLRLGSPEARNNCLTLSFELPFMPPKSVPISECQLVPALAPNKRNNHVTRFKSKQWRRLHELIGSRAMFNLLANCFIFTNVPPSCLVQLGGPLLSHVVRATAKDKMLRRRCYLRYTADLRRRRMTIPRLPQPRIGFSSTNDIAFMESGQTVLSSSRIGAYDQDVQDVRNLLSEMVQYVAHEVDYAASFSLSFGVHSSQQAMSQQREAEQKRRRLQEKPAYGRFKATFRFQTDDVVIPRSKMLYSRNLAAPRAFFRTFGDKSKRHRALFTRIFLRSDTTNMAENVLSKDVFKCNTLSGKLYKTLRQHLTRFTSLFNEKRVRSFLNRYCPLPQLLRLKSKRNRRGRRRIAISTKHLLDAKTESSNVADFVRTLLARLFPAKYKKGGDFWFGTRSNRRRMEKWVRMQVTAGRFWAVKVGTVVDDLNLAEVPWLKGWSRWQRRLLFSRFTAWLLGELVLGLVRAFFYVTDSAHLRNRVLFFRKPVWNSLFDRQLSAMLKSQHLSKVPMGGQVANKIHEKLINGNGFLASLRLLPKESNLRPVLGMCGRTKLAVKGGAPSPLISSANQQFESALQHLLFIRRNRPDITGYSVLNRDEFTAKWREYVFKRRFASLDFNDSRPLYFVKLDISKCFDTIDQTLLSSIFLSKMVRPGDDVFIRKMATVRVVGGVPRVQDRWCTSKITGAANSLGESCKALQTELGVRSAIIVDTDNFVRSTPEEIKSIFCKAVGATYVRTGPSGRQLYHLNRGIAQGSILSPMLCNIYYAEYEKLYIEPLLDPNEDLFVRQVDDFLMVSPSVQRARGILEHFLRGIPDFQIKINFDKLETNLPQDVLNELEQNYPSQLATNRSKVKSVRVIRISYCGFQIDTESLTIGIDWQRYVSLRVADTLTFTLVREPFQAVIRKLCATVFSFALPVALDVNLHSMPFVTSEIYRISLYLAGRLYFMLHSLQSTFPDKSADLIVALWYKIADMITSRIIYPSKYQTIVHNQFLHTGEQVYGSGLTGTALVSKTSYLTRNFVRAITLSALLCYLEKHKGRYPVLRRLVEFVLRKLVSICVQQLSGDEKAILSLYCDGPFIPCEYFGFVKNK